MRGLWKVLAVIFILALAAGLCLVDLRCSGKPGQGSAVARIADEMRVGKKEARYREAEELAALARDLRFLARQYTAKGEKKKAHRAIGAAQELDKKIRALREAK